MHQFRHAGRRFFDGQRGDVADRPAVDLNGPCLRPQTGALARRAHRLPHELRQVPPDPLTGAVLKQPAAVRQDALERAGAAAGAVPERLALPRPHLGKRLVHVDPQNPLGVTQQSRPVPRRKRPVVVQRQGAFPERQAAVRHQQRRVEVVPHAGAVACRTRPLPAVEREQPRVEVVEADVARRAEEFQAVQVLGVPRRQGNAGPLSQPQRLLQDVLRSPPLPRAHFRGANQDVDVVLPVAVQLRQRLQRHHLAVDSHLGRPVAQCLGQHVLVKSLAAAHRRRQQGDRLALVVRQQAHQDLLARLRGDAQVAGRAVLHADLGVQQAQVVVHLGDRRHRRVVPAARHPLLDGHGRRHAAHAVHVRLAQRLQELPRIRRQAFHVAPLALGEDDVERQRRFAGAAEAGDDHEPVARDVHFDILEVVVPCAADGDGAVGRWGNGRFPIGFCQLVGVGGRLQVGTQKPARVRGLAAAHLLRRARRHQMPPGIAALRPQVDEIVGALDHLHVVLDDQQRVALCQQALERPQQRGDVLEVQAGGGLVEDQQPLAALVQPHVERQLESLRLATGQGVERLPEAHVIQPHVLQAAAMSG